MGRKGEQDLQGEHPSHVPEPFPVTTAAGEHGGVVGCRR